MREQPKWVSKLQGFDFEIPYKKEANNMFTNSLSCLPELKAISTVEPGWKEEITVEHDKDEGVVPMFQDPNRAQKEKNGYTLISDLIFYENCRYLVSNSKFKERVLIKCHPSLLVGHVGFFETY